MRRFSFAKAVSKLLTKKTDRNTIQTPATGSNPLIIALEPRFMFDAAGAAAGAEAATEQAAETAAEAALDTAEATAGVSGDADTETLTQALATVAPPSETAAVPALAVGTNSATEVVIIDSRVEDRQTLRDGTRSDADVYILDASQDAVQQITEILSPYSDLKAVHIVSHGDEGVVHLGGQALSSATLDVHADDLAFWGRTLSGDGDILLYGCKVASGDGQGFVGSFAALTGADVAASNDPTGAAAQRGDWTLEYEVGTLETGIAFSAETRAAYDGVLALSTGDLAIVGVNKSDNTWAVLALTDIAANEIIFFTDVGWDDISNGFQEQHSSDGVITWNVGTDTLSAGTIVTFDLDVGNPFTISSSVGSVSFASAFDALSLYPTGTEQNIGFSDDVGDSLLIYQTDNDQFDGSPNLIFGYNSVSPLNASDGSGWFPSHLAIQASSPNSSHLPDSLADANVHQSDTSDEFGGENYYAKNSAYDFSVLSTGRQDELLAAITDPDNWTGSDMAITFATDPVTVTPPSQAPVITKLAGDTVTYLEDTVLLVIDQDAGATLTDPDSATFDGRTLTVSIEVGRDPAEDFLVINSVWSGPGEIGRVGNTVSYGGIVIGTGTNGFGSSDMVIRLNENATVEAVQALIRQIAYRNVDFANPTEGTRTIRFVLTDGALGTSEAVDTFVTVTRTNDAPEIDSG